MGTQGSRRVSDQAAELTACGAFRDGLYGCLRRRADALFELARRQSLGVIATNNVHHATPADARLAQVLAAIRARSSLDDMDGWLAASGAAYIRSGAEMARRLRRYPGVLERTVELGEQCAFDFKVIESPEALEEAIIQKAGEGLSARLTAGFCWPWSDARPDGTLEDDVVIGGFRRPWNARPEARKLAKGIPKALTWAHDPEGLGQVGCIYTAQGFEFDYVGVVFGSDLTYNRSTHSWEGHPENSHDSVVKRSGQKFNDLVKNTYRVLLTRGMRGCYVYFEDRDTESYFLSRMGAG